MSGTDERFAADMARVYGHISAAVSALHTDPTPAESIHYRVGQARGELKIALISLSAALRMARLAIQDRDASIATLQAMVERALTEPAPAPPKVPAEPASDVRMTGAE